MIEKIYRVYSPKGKFIVEGDAEKCADKLGIDMLSFERAAHKFRNGRYKKYRIYDVTDEYDEDELRRKTDADVIKAWDDFVTPIREYYGVPVRHLGEGKK